MLIVLDMLFGGCYSVSRSINESEGSMYYHHKYKQEKGFDMKRVFSFVFGVFVGACVMFSYCALRLSRPECLPSEFLVHNDDGEFLCVQREAVPHINQ